MIARFPQEEMCTQWVIPEVGNASSVSFFCLSANDSASLRGFFSSGGRDFRGFVQYLQKYESKSIHVISDAIWGQ